MKNQTTAQLKFSHFFLALVFLYFIMGLINAISQMIDRFTNNFSKTELDYLWEINNNTDLLVCAAFYFIVRSFNNDKETS